ncbi:MAG: hypothetical protein GY856_15205 [bacterium]|nr:hypothetical protein [bacterium]
MTCIVGIAEGGTVLLAGDSAAASLKDQEIYSVKNSKVFEVGLYLFGYTTSYRLGQILRYETEFPKPPADDLERFMATAFVSAIRRSLAVSGFERGLGEHGSILVGVNGQLFVIGTDLQVLSGATSYLAVGSGRRVAYGALYALEDSGKSPRERAEIALRAAQSFTPGVREPFIFVQV